MKMLFEVDGDVAKFGEHLQRLEADPTVASILVLACDDNGWSPNDLDPLLVRLKKPVFGGIFPQIIANGKRYQRGSVAVGLTDAATVMVLENISALKVEDMEDRLDSMCPHATSDCTMFVCVDGLTRHIGTLIEALFNQFGLAINFVGGGAGSLSLQQKPCVITPGGLRQDVAVLALSKMASGIGVAHGWSPISDRFKVTEAQENIIKSLDWRPAFQVYREIVEAHSGQRFTADNFFSIAKAYPFGISRLGAETVVRDPIMHQGDDLVCVGEVPSGTYVSILNGDTESLIAAAGHANERAEKAFHGSKANMRLFVDCISRVLFLEENFDRELASVEIDALPLVGMLSLGEIANSGRDYLEFYNKTAVVAMLDG